MKLPFLPLFSCFLSASAAFGCSDDETVVEHATPVPGGDNDTGTSVGTTPASVSAEVQAAADAAFVYGYPLTETMRVCDQFPVVNYLVHQTTVATPEERTIVLPNNDTLYTNACIYLGAGWVELTMPPPNGRYMSAEIFDAYTNEVLLASARDMPDAGQSYILHLSGTSGDGIPQGLPVIEVQTPFAFAMLRTLVNGPDDLADAHAAQKMISMTAAVQAAPPPVTVPTDTSMARDFFQKLVLRLAQNPPPPSQADLVASFAIAGVRASLTPDLAELTPEQLAAWDSAYAKGLAKLDADKASIGSVRGDWVFPSPEVASPGTNFDLRAIVARYGIFPLPPTESIYPRTQADGSTPHVLHLPSTWAPIDQRGFWSLTMYTEGYLFDNPLNRYSIGNRTPGVQREADGSLNIYVQCADPGGTLSSNWLPAPCGPYSMTMRLYLPDPLAQAPSFNLPDLE